MESNEKDALRALSLDADRAEAAAWVEYPPTPVWYPLGVGLWMAALILVVTGVDPVALKLAGIVAVMAVEIGFVTWYRRYRGAMPSSLPPAEFRRPAAWFVGSIVAALVVAVALAIVVAPWLGALAALVLVTPVTWQYERLYADAAERTRQRLA